MRLTISAFLAAATLSASGCVSILPEPLVPSALVSLPADRAQAPARPLLADVAVYPPEASRAFAGADIAVRSGAELVYLADVRWADAGPQLLQSAVINSLSQAEGPGRAVLGQLGAEVDYDLRWRIVDLSVGRDTAPVHVEVQVSLINSHTRRPVAQKSFSADGSPSDRASRARAAALAVAVQEMADEVAAFVTETVTKR
ncbi:MAG: ABC-type transport auxiliary lipoprotein family protein [Hyphomonadaceae bacterium]